MRSLVDTRDLRDPKELGAALLRQREIARTNQINSVFHLFADGAEKWNIPDVSKDDSMGKQCVREYRAELERRAGEGDKYAASALEMLRTGRKVEGFDPSGN